MVRRTGGFSGMGSLAQGIAADFSGEALGVANHSRVASP